MSTNNNRRPTILMAEDDLADQLIAKTAFEQAGIGANVTLVNDGSELLKYLRGSGQYANRREYPQADLLLTDLEMKGMGGRETLSILKKDPKLRKLPVIVMTSSADEKDVNHAYEEGAASYIVKPDDIDGWAHAFEVVNEYWLGIVTKPTDLS